MVNPTDPRNIQPTGKGGAHYTAGTAMPPEWLVASIPGAHEARAAFEAELAKGQELYRAYKAAQKSAPATKWIGEPGNAVPGPASGVTQAEWEKGQAAVQAAEDALTAQGKRSAAALRRFDALVYGSVDSADYKAMAVEHALKKHEEAVAAWEALKAALTEREEAHRAAGAPGRDWRNSAPVSYRNLASVETVIRPMLAAFDVDALKLTAEGERVPSAAEREAARQKLENNRANAMRAAVRNKNRRESIIERNAN